MDKYDRIAARGIDAVLPVLEKISCDGIVKTVKGSAIEKNLQALGADLCLWDKKDNFITIEVKASGPDNPNIKNLFVETITDIVHPRLGWLHKLQVDLFVHVSLSRNLARIFRWANFKTWLDQNIEKYRKTAVIQIDDRKSSVGYWISWRDIAFGVTRNHFGTYDLNRPETWEEKLHDMKLN
jgi:hypothetical protein